MHSEMEETLDDEIFDQDNFLYVVPLYILNPFQHIISERQNIMMRKESFMIITFCNKSFTIDTIVSNDIKFNGFKLCPECKKNKKFIIKN